MDKIEEFYNYKITIEYNGTGLVGWQRQKNGLSVQQILEEAASKFLGEQVEVVGAGRTDAGVHATGQVAHFKTSKNMPLEVVQRAFNFHMRPYLVVIKKVEQVDSHFHARFSANERSYLYKITSGNHLPVFMKNLAWHQFRKLDAQAMNEAAKLLLGKHDFTSFRAQACQANSPIITLGRCEVTSIEQADYEEIHFTVSARSFLHHMVRNIVGSLVLVGQGKWDKNMIEEALQAKDRAKAGPTAPPQGLYLTGVGY